MTDRMKHGKRKYVLAAVMLAMFMNAIEGTIVSTAMPAIVSDLGGFSLFSWVFSSYLLMNAVTVLIYGKLSDLYGRKPVLTFGIIVFLIGSVLCGLADSMTELILYRFLQGFGAGAVAPVASTIVGDIYARKERAKVQGYLSSVWGISAVMGPALGGLIVESLTWRLVFWINIPLGIASLILLWRFLHERPVPKKQKIDYSGAVLLTVSISCLMIVLVEGGVKWDWLSIPVLSLLILCAAAFTLFIRTEKRVPEPMMPFDIWRERAILYANLVSLVTGIIVMGLTSFLPSYVQGVMGKSPVVAGFTLTAMSLGWPLASTAAGRLLHSIGFRQTALAGGFSLILGTSVLAFMPEGSGPLTAASGSFLVGAGMGLTSTSFIVMIQGTVGWEKRGIATASNMFMRNLGNTIGAALLGGIMNSFLQSYLDRETAGSAESLSIEDVNQLLDPEAKTGLAIRSAELLQGGLSYALHNVYIIVLVFAFISTGLLFLLPKKRQEQETQQK